MSLLSGGKYMVMQGHAEAGESHSVSDKGTQSPSSLNGAELLGQYDSVVGKNSSSGSGMAGQFGGDKATGLDKSSGGGSQDSGQLYFSDPYKSAMSGSGQRSSGDGKSLQMAQMSQPSGSGGDAAVGQKSDAEASFNHSVRTDLRASAAAAQAGEEAGNRLKSSPSLSKDGSLSAQDQEQLFKAASGMDNKKMLEHFQNYVNHGLDGKHPLSFSREFDSAGKATNVIKVMGADGKPVREYRK